MLSVKKIIVFVSILFLAIRLHAGGFEIHYGIGVVSVHPYNYFSLSFWKTPKDKIAFDQLYFERDSGSPMLRCGFATTGIDSVPSWFAPEIFTLDDEKMRFNMRCIRKDGNWCQVVVNNQTGETKWVELGIDIVFYDWGMFYSNMGSIEIISGSPVLYEQPNKKSKFILIQSKDVAGMRQQIRAQKIEGNWMYVEVTEYDENMKETGRRTGWIKWRDADKPLIAYNIMGC